MKKLLNTILFSKDLRKNLLVLDALLDVANSFGEVCEVNRSSREYMNQIRDRMNKKPGLICRIELRELHRQLRILRGRISQKTVLILNHSEMKAA